MRVLRHGHLVVAERTGPHWAGPAPYCPFKPPFCFHQHKRTTLSVLPVYLVSYRESAIFPNRTKIMSSRDSSNRIAKRKSRVSILQLEDSGSQTRKHLPASRSLGKSGLRRLYQLH